MLFSSCEKSEREAPGSKEQHTALPGPGVHRKEAYSTQEGERCGQRKSKERRALGFWSLQQCHSHMDSDS